MILIFGDVIIDRYVYGTKLGVSAETPTIVAEYQGEEKFLGGAGLVLRHIMACGYKDTNLLTVCDESQYDTLYSLFNGEYIKKVDFIKKSDWKITSKQRMYVDSYKMLQYDVRNTKIYSEEDLSNVTAIIEDKVKRFKPEIVVISDNAHGVVVKHISNFLINNQSKYGYAVFVDAQWSQSRPKYNLYNGADSIFVNEKEFYALMEDFGGYDAWLNNCKSNIIIKKGPFGAMAYYRTFKETLEEHNFISCPTDTIDVVDTCGAGDAFLAAYCANLKLGQQGALEAATKYATRCCTVKGTKTFEEEFNK